ncbi:MAG: VOC family protein [Oscillospiraceae bacterium]|nr:VOC family protein [Oscillospiraceae bacterium]
MKISPYLWFNGNCAEAVALYEKAFHVKAEVMPNEEAENLVGHAQFKLGNDFVMLCDVPADAPATFGNNMQITINFDAPDADAMKAAFHALKEDGEVLIALEENDWSKCFGLVVDKFGVMWSICQN